MDQSGVPRRRPPVPEPSVRRLPIYYHLLQTLFAEGLTSVSATALGGRLQLDPTQVRKDLEVTGVTGKPKVGYNVSSLIRQIEEFLGWDRIKEAVLVGVGSLGTALLGYRKFRGFGLDLVAAFDEDPRKAGLNIAGTAVLPMEQLVGYCRRTAIRLAVITTPPAAAQSVANALVDGGIRAIWNFAPVHIHVPPTVLVQNEDLYRSLASLSFRLGRMMEAERDPSIVGISAHPEPNSSSPYFLPEPAQ
jgi:redox-sensing transcriptional repressor